MLDFGFSEVIVTSMIALVVLGPKRLPGVMRKAGNWMGRARVMARQLSEQLEREINAEELLRETAKQPVTPAPSAGPAPAAELAPGAQLAPAAHLPPLPPDLVPAAPETRTDQPAKPAP